MIKRLASTLLIISLALLLCGCGDCVFESCTAGDSTPPTVPGVVALSVVSSTQIDIAWESSEDDSGVMGYLIYRNSVVCGGVRDTRAALSSSPVVMGYSDTVLSPGTEYCYTVSAYDLWGNVSEESPAQCATTTGTPEESNNAPVADAGADQSVSTGTAVTLNGSLSSDPDGDSITYAWTIDSKPGGSSATLLNASMQSPTITPDVAGAYVISLVVSDGTATSAADTVTITASAVNTAPTANAGPDQSVSTGTAVTLSGALSSDPESDPLTYAWSITNVPADSMAVLYNSTSATATFTPDIDGVYTISLTVSDSALSSAPDTMIVNASTAVVNNAPVAAAGNDQSVNVLSTVNLSGSLSTDADSDPLTYSWTITSSPSGSTATITNATSAAAYFTADKPGTFIVSLVVNDGTANSAADTLVVTVARLVWSNYAGMMNAYGNPFAEGSDGTIYTGRSNSIWAINHASGATLWQADFLDSSIGGVAFYNSSVYGAAYSSSASTYLYGYNTDGTQQFATLVGTYLYGPVVDSSNIIHLGGSGSVRKYNPAGVSLLTISTGAITPIYFTPAVAADGTIYFGGTPALLYAYNSTGVQKWTYSAGARTTHPSFDDNGTPGDTSDDTVYIGSWDNNLHAVNASDGTVKWTFPTGGYVVAQPVIGPDGTIYVGSGDMKFYAINPDGTEKWSYTTGGTVYSSAALSSDGTVYVGSADKVLYAFNSDGTLKWSETTAGSFSSGGPIISSSCVIYAAPTGMYLYAYYDDCAGPESTRWPTFNRNNARTGQGAALLPPS